MQTHTRAHLHAHTYTHVHTHAHAYLHARAHTRAHTCMHAHTCAHPGLHQGMQSSPLGELQEPTAKTVSAGRREEGKNRRRWGKGIMREMQNEKGGGIGF